MPQADYDAEEVLQKHGEAIRQIEPLTAAA
jgi:hypothetical protein